MPKRIMFTGGSGKAGRHVLPWLLGRGYEILNFDLQPFENTDIFWLIGDVTDSRQVFNAMTLHFGRRGLLAGKPPNPVDAVVHFAAIPRVFIKADNETYRVNVMGTYNVIETAMKLGIRKVVIASSETTYGVCSGLFNALVSGGIVLTESGMQQVCTKYAAPDERGFLRRGSV